MIRRPLFFAAISFLCAVLWYFLAGRVCAYIVLVIILFVCFFAKGRVRKISVIALIFYSVSMINCVFYESFEAPLERYADTEQKVEVVGEIAGSCQKTSSSGNNYVQLKVVLDMTGRGEDSANSCTAQDEGRKPGIFNSISAKRNKLLVNIYDEEVDSNAFVSGYIVKISGKVDTPNGKKNPNCFDYRLYLQSVGITNTMTAEDIKILNKRDTLGGKLHLLKDYYATKMEASIGTEAAGFVKGVMFGEKEDISEDVMEEFQRNGTAHILAVSGLHIGMIYGVISGIWRWKKGKLYFITVSIFLCCYCILASFSPSVIRAVFMVEMHLVSKMINRRYDLSSAAFLIAILMVLNNPMQIFNAGFQMSFLAVLTLSVIMTFVKSIYRGMFAASISVQIGLLPYTMYMFNYVSAAAVLVNVPIIFLTGIMVPLCLAALPASVICDPLFDIISKPVHGICTIIQNINSAACIEGVTSFDVVSPGRAVIALFYIGILVFLSEEGRLMMIRHGKKAVIIMISVCVVFSAIFGNVTRSGFEKARIVFVDVGQGDCMHFKTEEGKNYLIDGGGKKDYNVGKEILKPYLLKNGVKKADGAFVTHMHQDHYKGIAELCREGMVEKLFIYEGNRSEEKEIVKETGIRKENIVYLKKGDLIKLGEDTSAEVMWPETAQKHAEDLKNDDENEVSLILKVNIGEVSFMATGDVNSSCHEELVKAHKDRLSTDILKVAHHGSKYSYSESFTKFSFPRYAVFQVGENTYGHPNEEVLEKYEDKGIEIYRNDEDGAIGFVLSDTEKVVTVVQ